MGKTIGEMMEEMRIRAGAMEYKGHEYLDLYLNDTGYGKAKEFQDQGYIQIRSHARVSAGNLHYDSRSQER